MTQRNPMNERYADEARKGHARKSAASAKPKTSAASTVTLPSSTKTPKEKKMERKAREREAQEKDREMAVKYSRPDTPEYYKWKRFWWIGLGLAIALVLGSWLLRSVEPQWISLVVLGLAYVAIIFAFWVDITKIKKITRKWQQEQIAKEKKANKGKSKKQIEEEAKAKKEEEVRLAREAAEKTVIGRMKLSWDARKEKKAKEKEEKKKSDDGTSTEETTQEGEKNNG